ncbi:Pimeloyl-ACP methyl ester carboxylesterase [Geodermatophilus aquaeductus]|uniref:Pimeloyl-ACP methyl ester carboxylesterase n=1 Tax=Geodermatophilus aquaeductus TaxID=1564161 RepID=A0A521FVG2_9ACTN|nr:alpha/beta hydrolase [Geodermatophilus aquaeductus]SMO99510.1 Pimeloyl-ACP methyl ester carboxylesterase [Geodermatophilus aquaeductus]
MTVTEAAGGGFEALQHVALNGVSLAYREVGRGEPVVLVHGGLGDLRTWAAQLEPLGARCRVIAYSRRYARPNEPIAPGAVDPMPVHVADLVTLLHTLGAAPAHLVGSSWGAFICLLTAIEHPEVVRSLVLEEPPLLPLVLGSGPRPQPAVLMRSLRRRPRATLAVLGFGLRTSAPMAWAYRRGDDERALQLFARGVLGRQALARLTPERRQQMRESADTLRAEFRAGFPPLTEPDIRAVRAPALLLTGEHSPTIEGALSDWLADLLPDAEQLAVPGASHLMHEDDPAFVTDAIVGFVTRGRPPG